MNKSIVLPALIVILLGLGAWWITSKTSPDDAMMPTPAVSASPTVPPNITITSPVVNALVGSPVIVTGKARVFENTFNVRVKDSSGKIVYETFVMTDAKDAGIFGNYSIKVPLPANQGTDFVIESISYSAKGDGSLEGYASVPVKLNTVATSTVQVAFTVNNDCQTVRLYPRTIVKTSEVAFMSLIELMEGPTTQEKIQGALTSIPDGTGLNSIRISGNTAYADFNHVLDQGAGGSCRVTAIRSQITNTLKQFPNITSVIISINGRTEDILQP
ncbi:MAG: hypothetical protein A3J46_00180 [Candidatus Yanofskybacteria bacterium RIFCSPHIGHO2_02_FULL_41_11]|uniref:GerMN domain-containing protein n=1 Tax=Candidatus Yanofskybacteria bacterium RIFCSPHIGHO2_02_FULL_41_11 TaxID=1802675 RepID=A0A1F8F9U5_9BACT|nr:MAG: hypothetical protein UW86_C0007G0005 [Microgenomates group bacterium GW2011_GWA1_Microgenomates_45_10]OGN09026.1 MAG: hypothetical protein A3J46_00180 [Candidatus Yanofskybacteria bacterium RIFCSPHIGHO2_02_FULL_41_11]